MRTRTHAAVSRDDDEDTDLNLLPPVCYLTRPINALLLKLLDLSKRHRRILLPIAALLYAALMVLFGKDWFLVAIAPLGLGLAGILGYIGLSIVMLALFARHPGTRLTCVAIVQLLLIGPELILTLDDTLLLLKFGEHAAFVLIALHTLIMVFVYPQYGHRLMPYAHWSLIPLLLASVMIWFESSQAFAYSKIGPRDFELHNCTSQSVHPRGYDRAVIYQTCDVRLFMDGRMYELNGMTVPYGTIDHMAIRHALFDHYRVRVRETETASN